MKKITLLFIALVAVCACAPRQEVASTEVVGTVLHKEDVAPLSADSVINLLRAGNENFTSGNTTNRSIQSQLAQSAEDGQYPMAIVLSCIDSRVPVEMLFDMGLGDLFVTRVAGNVVSGDVLGSMEYACEHAGSKVVLVLGHTSCGAVHSACEGVEAGNMTDMLAKIKPAIATVSESMDDDAHSAEFQNAVVVENVNNMISRVRAESEILAHLESEGEIKIVGGVFDLSTGEVEIFEQ